MTSRPTTLVPIHQLVARLSPALTDQALAFVQENEREVFSSTMTLMSEVLKFRPQIWKTWPRQRQRDWLRDNLRQGRFADTAQQLLQEWFFGKRVDMMTRFLDTLGIAHDKDGYIEGELPETLDAAKVAAAVDALLKDFPAEEVALYLHLFQRGQEDGWAAIGELLATDERLKI